ncbi:hypothetical protein H6P81_006715 [Aristolochia fimbriata]|uniref:Uncharacterized protein n=1 Tax=Aristolochia fimbriata TaxID=158543 RepID=A0AAV7F1T3_ARIFI|nr:hypothetical protein H6P81_006715 [Aristolochia fimbriata]
MKDREREKEREREREIDRDRHRERDHKRRYRDEPPREVDDRHHGDKYRDDGSRGRVYRDESNHERSRDRESRSEREGSRDRFRDSVERDRSYREDSAERRHSSSSHKRKDRGESEDRLDNADKRRKEEKREKRRFKDQAVEEVRDEKADAVKPEDKRRNEVQKGDSAEPITSSKPEKVNVDSSKNSAVNNGSGSIADGSALKPLAMPPEAVSESNTASNHTLPSKVSSITTTNENKGVSITRSHEVPGKSSTDGTSSSSSAGKSERLTSLDALLRAKKALQMRKESWKKDPLLNKSSTSGLEEMNKEGTKAPLSLPSTTSTIPVGAAVSMKPPASSFNSTTISASNFEAVKRARELAARMGFHQDPEFGNLINVFPGQSAPEVAVQQKPAKAPVLRLDALGREIDEHGNVINVPKPTSTLKVNINKQKKEAFQILKPDLDESLQSNPHFDDRMGINKTKLLRPKRMSFQFVEEGKLAKQAELFRIKSQFGEAQAKELKTKQAQLAKAKAELADINPNLIEISKRVDTKEKPKDIIPDVEWWDLPLLNSAAYPDVMDGSIEDKLKMDKITMYVEHPLPIEPPAEPAPPPPQPLKLTKKEQKKLRTQRRVAKEQDRQEMVRQGLIEPPKAKVKMSNLMKVLGAEATQDPTRLEMEIRSAAAEREQAHVDRNIAHKLTPAEPREKKERKLFDDPNTLETLVSVYKINDLTHPQTRFKVDVNAQENRLTGCAVISDGLSVVVVEGGSKSIKRYGKLMLRRINWAAAVPSEDGEEKDEDAPLNKCVLVWQGSVAKPSFNRFLVHQCRTEAAARKVFSDAGVGHYWDLSVNYSEDQI